MHAGSSVQSVDLQPRIVGEHVGAGTRQTEIGSGQSLEPTGELARFLGGVLGESRLVFHDRRCLDKIRQAQVTELVTEDGANFLYFVSVTRGQNQSRHVSTIQSK